jgi:hypothetical protein
MTVDITAFAELIGRFTGLDPETAERYANAIGDTPEVDAQGLVVIRNGRGEIIDRISIPLS